jgi:hypothetical protein
MTTKLERRNKEIAAHLEALQQLVNLCGGSKYKISTINSKLRNIEFRASRDSEKYCNGGIDTNQFGERAEGYKEEVQALFNGNLKGLKINSDCRGYALKIHDETMANEYKEIRLNKDWGGYGLLAPEITGN